MSEHRSCEWEIDRLRSGRDEARALLREVEWRGCATSTMGTVGYVCPVCGRAREQLHARDCRLDAFLAGEVSR